MVKRMTPDTSDRLITVRDAADRLSIGVTKFYELMSRGEIPMVKIDRATRVRLSDVERFIRAGAISRN